jgi:TrmH family RNA methyltransferase
VPGFGSCSSLNDFDFDFVLRLVLHGDGAVEDAAIVQTGFHVTQEISSGGRGAFGVEFDDDSSRLRVEPNLRMISRSSQQRTQHEGQHVHSMAACATIVYIGPQLTVVLVSTRNPLNIGAAARAVANFGLDDLRLVDPYDVAFREAVSAVGGAHVLQTARVFETLAEAVSDCSLVVGTTAAQKRVPQQPVERLEAGGTQVRNHTGRVALLFGSEKFGLSNDDMSFCHTLIRIPTAPGTPSMNLGQAVAVCLYELIRQDTAAKPVRFEAPAGKDAEQMTQMLLKVLRESGYTNRITAVSTEQKIHRWIRRLRISRKDAPLLMGILRQVLWKFKEGRDQDS